MNHVACIHILHENDEWLPPFREALRDRGLPWREWHLASGGFDLDAPPPAGVYYNRMSASAHARDHRYAPEYAATVLAWLALHCRRVVNGSRSLDLELSKVRQYAALREVGLRVPATRVATETASLLEAGRQLPAPYVLKPNRGGKGLGVQRFESSAALVGHIESFGYQGGPDGIALLQSYVLSPRGTIVRCEFVGGRFLYAVEVDASRGFELCPAEACAIEDLACPVGERADDGRFNVLAGFTRPELALCERFLAANEIDVAGIEMVIDASDQVWVYDVNTNTNYNPAAEARAGLTGTRRSGAGAVADYLGGRLDESAVAPAWQRGAGDGNRTHVISLGS